MPRAKGSRTGAQEFRYGRTSVDGSVHVPWLSEVISRETHDCWQHESSDETPKTARGHDAIPPASGIESETTPQPPPNTDSSGGRATARAECKVLLRAPRQTPIFLHPINCWSHTCRVCIRIDSPVTVHRRLLSSHHLPEAANSNITSPPPTS